MRLVSTVEPTPIPDLARFKLDRLEIVPCAVTPPDTACLLVRYFNYKQNNVEGDNFFETVTEALNYAEEIYGVSISEWCVEGIEHVFLDSQEMYQSVLTEHFHKLKAQEVGRA